MHYFGRINYFIYDDFKLMEGKSFVECANKHFLTKTYWKSIEIPKRETSLSRLVKYTMNEFPTFHLYPS